MVSTTAKKRLTKEYKNLTEKPSDKYVARPIKNPDGSKKIDKWVCYIPGPNDTVWEDGLFKLTMEFPSDYPLNPPKCSLLPPLPHPNIYPSGRV